MAGKRILIHVGSLEVEVEAVPVVGTEATSGKVSKAAGSVLDAFGRAQETIIAVAQSTADMIDQSGAVARPDGVEVEFGLKFSASGGVIMAGASGEATLKVTLRYDVAARRAAGLSASASPEDVSMPNASMPMEAPAESAAVS